MESLHHVGGVSGTVPHLDVVLCVGMPRLQGHRRPDAWAANDHRVGKKHEGFAAAGLVCAYLSKLKRIGDPFLPLLSQVEARDGPVVF